jgi:ABC-type sugar transport system ATPase subunit
MIELLGLCDRILVMRAGRIAGAVPRQEFSQERIMQFAALG